MELNKEQQAAVYCEENAVVSAGAGSGKTMVLANRFVWLLTEKGFKIDEILTLTFTKKAAAQMYKRIHSLITEIAEKETGIKAKRAKEALSDFIKARIQTLDSYSASIVKQSATHYGLSPDFQIDQDRCKKLALQISYPFFITHRSHPAIKKFYSACRPNEIVHNILADILFNYSLIGKPVNLMQSTQKQFDIICDEWDTSVKEFIFLIEETKQFIQEDEAWLPDIIPIINNYKNIKSYIPNVQEIREFFNDLFSLSSDIADNCMEKSENHPIQNKLKTFVYYLLEFKKLNLSKGKRKDNPVKKNVYLIREIFETISSIAISCSQAGITISIMPLLAELQEKYLLHKRTEGVLTFSDVSNLAKTVLLEHHDIRQSEKESFKAIMIDEFQDNNELQKELLFLLAEKIGRCSNNVPLPDELEKGKLFFVGDEKQSIYLFRGADVSVFRRLKNEIKQNKEHSAELPLKINYRSSPSLIKAFNTIMPSVFAPDKNLPLYEAGYSPLEAYQKFDGNLFLCIHNSNKEENEENENLSDSENEAFFIAKKIRKLIDEKKYEPKDIALLFRTRTGQHIYEKHLRLQDIPYSSEDIGNLFYGGPVNDIMSVLRLTAHPQDSASYAEMLRSPFTGLSLSGTALCLSCFSAEETPIPFDDKPLETLDENDKEKYLNGRNIYLSILEKSKTLNVSELVSELWYNKGYQYETEWNPQVRVYRELFDYLYHLAVMADQNNQGLSGFTDLILSYRDSGAQLTDIDIPLERAGLGGGCVHIMTIHKSKGLEFPVVFLCGCGRKSRSDSPDAYYFSENTGIALSLPVPDNYSAIPDIQNNYFWYRGHEEAKRKETAELRRLLYVGMTRAEKELYITGSLKIKEQDNADSETDNDFFNSIKNHVTVTCEERWKKQPNAIEGDIILDNGTFFGILLPSVVAHNSGSLYSLEEIPSFTEDIIRKPSDQYSLNEYIENTETLYKKAKLIKTPLVQKKHKNPVSLRNAEKDAETLQGKDCFIDKSYSGENSLDIFNKVDTLILKLAKDNDETSERFNSGSFGTIAHICAEARLNEQEPVIPSNIMGLLKPDESEALLDAGKQIASRFVNSPLGLIAKNAHHRESEFPFRTIIKNNDREVFINGTIDLFFEADDFIHIVDFKTDAREIPAEHAAQMTCYFRAVSELFAQKECRIWLYYLRTGHAVEMTEKVKKFNLEQRVFSL